VDASTVSGASAVALPTNCRRRRSGAPVRYNRRRRRHKNGGGGGGVAAAAHSSTLKRLHWLPIDARIKFKIATLTYKASHTWQFSISRQLAASAQSM